MNLAIEGRNNKVFTRNSLGTGIMLPSNST